jgi:hypothetical protein
MWVQGVDLREIERALLQHMRGDDAAGAIRAAADRTRDLLPTAVRVAEIVNGLSDEQLAATSETLLLRLELGLPERLVAIARHVGARLTRGAYLALLRAGLTTPEAVERLAEDELARILGSKSAVSLLRARLADA